MKRWVSGALAFIITFSFAQGSLALCAGEVEEETVSALTETLTDPADIADADGIVYAQMLDAQSDPVECELTLGEDDGACGLEENEPEPQAAPEAAVSAAPRYARIATETAGVHGTPEGAAFAALNAGCAVLVLDSEASDWTKIAFFTERGIETGCVDAGCLNVLNADETAAYLKWLAENAEVAFYNDDLSMPLEPVACAYADAEAPSENADAPQADPAAETPDQTGNAGNAGDTGDTGNAGDTDNAGDTGNAGDVGEAPETGDAAAEAPAGEPAEDADEEKPEAPAEEDPEEAEEIVATSAMEAVGQETPQEAPAETLTEALADPQAAEAAENPETADDTQTAEAASGIRLNMSKCAMGLKETFSGLAFTATPEVSASDVVWTTSNGKIVKVDPKTGVIKGVKKGTATVTVTTADGRKASVEVTVKKAPKKAKFSPTHLTLGAGGMSVPLTLKLSKGAASAGIAYASSNESVVTVAANGVVTSRGVGSAVITAYTYNKKKAVCRVNVFAEPTRAEMPATYALAVHQSSQLGVQVFAADGARTEAALTFRISPNSPDPNCICVDGVTGGITAVSKGTAYVTAITHNGISCGPCEVIVTSAPSAIKLPGKVVLGVKETREQLPVELVNTSGDSNCAADITWSSTNSKVVSVDPDTGAIKALKKGTAFVVAKTHNGLKARCKVTVKKAPKKVALKSAGSAISVGATTQFTVKLPKGAAGGYTFSSSDPAVATVDQNGLAKGVAAGKATITVTTYNGKTASVTLTVNGSSDPTTPTTPTTPDPSIEVPETLKKLGLASYQNTYSKDMTNAQKLEYVIYNAQNQLGKPYVYGSGYKTAHPSGFDCSGLVYWCFYKLGIELGESAYKQGYDKRYTKVTDIASLKRGDVICFNTVKDSDLSDHTGIYLGEYKGKGYFIHASSGKSKQKVVVQCLEDDSLSDDYYKRNFSWGRRILG